MSVLPPEEIRSLRVSAQAAGAPVDTLAGRWEALGHEAEQLAQLAGLGPHDAMPTAFPEAIERTSQWQRDLVRNAVEDIEAMMQPGLTALCILAERGQDVSAPALTLWRELHAARSAVLRVLAAEESSEPTVPVL